jgi:hypothetical protein
MGQHHFADPIMAAHYNDSGAVTTVTGKFGNKRVPMLPHLCQLCICCGVGTLRAELAQVFVAGVASMFRRKLAFPALVVFV